MEKQLMLEVFYKNKRFLDQEIFEWNDIRREHTVIFYTDYPKESKAHLKMSMGMSLSTLEVFVKRILDNKIATAVKFTLV